MDDVLNNQESTQMHNKVENYNIIALNKIFIEYRWSWSKLFKIFNLWMLAWQYNKLQNSSF